MSRWTKKDGKRQGQCGGGDALVSTTAFPDKLYREWHRPRRKLDEYLVSVDSGCRVRLPCRYDRGG